MKKRILFGVCLICVVRKLKCPFVGESFIFAMLIMFLFYFVSVPSVLTNMSASENFYRYFMMAFSNTDSLVKLVLVSVGVTVLFFVRNITVHTTLKQLLA